MKFIRVLILYLVICLVIALCSGCGDIEINGIENFSENSCDKGLNDNLLPKNRDFLTEYPYLKAEYQYWTDGSFLQYKTFVQLHYPEDVYESAKSACQKAYASSSTGFSCGEYSFCEPRYLFDGERGFQIFGFEDETCTLLFVGSYGFPLDKNKPLTSSTLAEFLRTEFGL